MKQDRAIQLWDGGRNFFSRSLQALGDSFAMILLVEAFEADLLHKSILGGAMGLGLLLGAPFLRVCQSSSWNASRLLALLMGISGLACFLAAWATNIWVYIIFVTVAYIMPYAGIPLSTEIYSQYDSKHRGNRFLSSVILSNLGVLVFAGLGGWFIEGGGTRGILLSGFAVVAWISMLCSLMIPCEKVKRNFKSLGQMWTTLAQDRLFRYMCIAWFMMGTANLWLYPYRTNYLLEDQFGHNMSPEMVVLLVVMVPECLRLVSSPIFAWLFDRINFILLRMFLNALFGIYTIIFFTSTSFAGALIGMMVLGVAQGGGMIAWQLWVTRLAPKEKAPGYMAVHTFLTGIRRVCTPLLGLWALQNWGGLACSSISLVLIGVSIIMMAFLIPMGRQRFVH